MQILKESGIRNGIQYEHFDCLDSTSNYIKKQIKAISIDSLAVIADIQTKGRGQDTKTFVSNLGGLYLSIVFPFKPFTQQDTKLGVVVAQEIKEILQQHYNITTTVKPPNDLYLSGKKLAGILPESVIDINGNRRLIIGIGINVNTFSFPNELTIATSMYLNTNKEYNINLLSQLIIQRLIKMYNEDFKSKSE